MSLSAQQGAAANQAIADIEQLRSNVLFRLESSYGFWLSDSSSRDAARQYLRVTAVAGEAGLADELIRVGEDQVSWERWVADAKSLRDTVASIDGDYSTWSFESVLLNTARATVGDIGDGLDKLGKALPTGAAIGAGAVIFLVGAYVAWKVLS